MTPPRPSPCALSLLLGVLMTAQSALGQSAATPSTDAAATTGLRIAVYDFELSDVDERTGKIVYRATLAELRKLEWVSVIGMDEIRAMLDLEAQKAMIGCDEEESCLAEIAGAIGADVLILGQLARLGDQHIFTLRRVDQRRAQVVGTVNRTLAADNGEEFLAVIGPSVAELFPDRSLRMGATRGVSKEAALKLNPPPLRPWMVYAAGSVAGAALVGSAVSSLIVLALSGSYADELERGSQAGQLVDGAQLTSLRNSGTTAMWASGTLFASALAIGGAATGMAFFTDWDDVAHAE